jgi:hypothetical protein
MLFSKLEINWTFFEELLEEINFELELVEDELKVCLAEIDDVICKVEAFDSSQHFNTFVHNLMKFTYNLSDG